MNLIDITKRADAFPMQLVSSTGSNTHKNLLQQCSPESTIALSSEYPEALCVDCCGPSSRLFCCSCRLRQYQVEAIPARIAQAPSTFVLTQRRTALSYMLTTALLQEPGAPTNPAMSRRVLPFTPRWSAIPTGR